MWATGNRSLCRDSRPSRPGYGTGGGGDRLSVRPPLTALTAIAEIYGLYHMSLNLTVWFETHRGTVSGRSHVGRGRSVGTAHTAGHRPGASPTGQENR